MSTTRHQSQTSSPAETSQENASGAPGEANKVHVVTFGCQMNKYDSELVEGRFKRRGYETVSDMGDADIVLFNTCSVRDHAEERTWSWVGELKKVKAERPDLVVGVMGCMAQRVEAEIFKRAGHVDLVAGTRQFHLLPKMVEELRARRMAPDKFAAKERRLLATDMAEDVVVDRAGEEYSGGHHAYLAVMRGCDLNCTYCIVPTTRGRVRSRPIDELVREAEWYASQGVKVLTLLGQTINSYGEDFEKPGTASAKMRGRQGRPSLADLLERLEGIDGLKRIRLITLHPSYINKPFAEAIRDYDKVEKFVPIPAQAGSDDVLKRMKRGYTMDLYRRRADILRDIVPNIELGSDWIVGFPGETDADFDGSEAFLEEQGFVVNYVFKYDPRPKTRSDERMDDDVPEAVKKERNQRLLRMAEKTQRKRLAAYRGKTVPVFIESQSERDDNTLLGRTPWGMPVSFTGGAELVGTDVDVSIDETTAYGMAGRRAEDLK